ncbi:MAG: HEPN domain-containing protein [Chloroflexota bacterium]
MKDNRDLSKGWLEKARSDLYASEQLLAGTGPYDSACFHAQQAIEKALKALLALYGQNIPRTHDLEELQRTCVHLHPISELQSLDLSEATDYAVQLRYDIEFWPEQETALQAYHLAERVVEIITDILN